MLLSFISTNIRIFASSPNKRARKEEPIFEIAYLEEALNFLASLDSKVKSKITYNIGKSMYYIDKELFKKLENTEGSSAPSTTNSLIGCLRFGTLMKTNWS